MNMIQAEMPRYKSHKTVWALQIAEIREATDDEHAQGIGGFITPDDEGYGEFTVTPEYMEKHEPYVGGYYVVYKGGYKSFSPAQDFEDGYTKI